MHKRARLPGRVRVRLTIPDAAAFLDRCVREGITPENVRAEDALTLAFTLRRAELAPARRLAERMGGRWHTLSVRGPAAGALRLRRHALFFAGLGTALALLAAASLFVWEIRVTENDSDVPDAEILRVLAAQGVGPGSFWPAFRGERIRTAALTELPALCFLAVNVRSGKAEVTVKKALPPPEIVNESVPSAVTARRGGVIESIFVLSGTALVKRGDAVVPGQTLVTSDGVRPRAGAEVTARTWTELTAAAPLTVWEKTPAGADRRAFSLLLGNGRINFTPNSGILPGECDRITKKWDLAAEGAFSLPVHLVSETVRPFALSERTREAEALRPVLEARLTERLRAELGNGGEILSLRFTAAERDGALLVTLRAECLERIDENVPQG